MASSASRHRFLLFGSAEPEIDPVTLVENYKKIEDRFEKRRQFLNENCEILKGIAVRNVTKDERDRVLDDIWENVLAGLFS